MASKVSHKHNQKRTAASSEATLPERKKKGKGFTVGPANLPDGTYRRKAQKIKADLIHKAKVRKTYAKLKEKKLPVLSARNPYLRDAEDTEKNTTGQNDDKPVSHDHDSNAAPKIHPDRQAMIDRAHSSSSEKPATNEHHDGVRPRRKRRPKPNAFAKELAAARRREEEAERRRKQREENQRDREAMAKAKRPDQFGKRRLGRESSVLLERVKRMSSNQ